ncbi:MAG: hypothetical protein H0W73_10765 [Bacteroidetes bacterium]|nr:hypothetical protein [Bacteroidota bacterium]
MKIQLLKGQFTSKDALDIITKMIHIKIKYHEEKIKDEDEEETIKMRENRIIKLQKELYELRKFIESNGDTVSLESEINLIS